MPKTIFIYCLVCCFFLLNGCANIDSESDKQTSAPIARAPLDGIWTGEFDIGGRGPYDFTAIHLGSKVHAYSQRAKAMCIGVVKLDGENYTSKCALFALDGGPFDLATITGKLKGQSEIVSQFVTLNGGDIGTLNLTYNPIYDFPSSLQMTVGNWLYTDRDNLTTEFAIVEEGAIAGHDSDDCEYLGNTNVINPAFNVYQIKVEISRCGPVNGKYEGVSFIKDNQLSALIINENYALLFIFERK